MPILPLVDATPVAHLTRPATAELLRKADFPTPRPRRGVLAYRLRYATVTAAGTPTTASALLVLPRDHRRRLRTLAYEHGTLVRRSDAPSSGLDNYAAQAAMLFAGAGYAVVAPDYLGLGSGAGSTTYLHAATEASASLDAVRAARVFARSRGRTLDGRLDVVGFSQGGHAALALDRAIEQGADPALGVRAVASISGPLALEQVELPAILDGRLDGRISGLNVANLLFAWGRVYPGLQPAPATAFAPPYAARLARLFDGRHADGAILGAMPSRVTRLLTPTALARLRAPSGPLLTALRDADAVCDWAPRARMALFAARADSAVAYNDSTACADALAAHGARPRVVDLGHLDHFPSMFAGVPRALAWLQRTSR
ncbi:MAG TPA: lipase family protein [Baekduia sp.]|uniref:lipase family protein n=1 Tax=Baekduia sp. TaxID=2600305 RepID=UPI002D78C159|nr:lipase family protein [Baekduia sp.]HET6508715.1 lipase family protein [Baekduia sp.]